MAEMLSPNRTQLQKQRVSFLSPVNTFCIGSNDDNLERAQARAARAASIRRKSVKFSNAGDADSTDAFLGQEQIMELYQNCIKLAIENKINQKNAWELNLIDHLWNIIKVEENEVVFMVNYKSECEVKVEFMLIIQGVHYLHRES